MPHGRRQIVGIPAGEIEALARRLPGKRVTVTSGGVERLKDIDFMLRAGETLGIIVRSRKRAGGAVATDVRAGSAE